MFKRENKLKSWEQLLIILSFCQTQKVLIINSTAERGGSGLEDHRTVLEKSSWFFSTQSQAHNGTFRSQETSSLWAVTWGVVELYVFLTLYPPADVHCKKRLAFFPLPQPGCHLSNSPWLGIYLLFPARESLASDIPAEDGKTANIFFTV
jgi:hypothetical protein